MNALTGDMARSKKEEFASRLLRWRTQRGWSREESAAKLCVSHRTLATSHAPYFSQPDAVAETLLALAGDQISGNRNFQVGEADRSVEG
jgi:transcriptional regulator with XRE-family HTH domain